MAKIKTGASFSKALKHQGESVIKFEQNPFQLMHGAHVLYKESNCHPIALAKKKKPMNLTIGNREKNVFIFFLLFNNVCFRII